MSREEVAQLLATIALTYPNFDAKDKSKTIDAWYLFLEEYSLQEIQVALKAFVKGSGSKFPPSISELIGYVHKPETLSTMNEHEAWSLVRKALENGIYNSQREFDNLPELVQKAVGSANQIHVWASDPDYDEGVMSSNFMRAYRTVCTRQEEYNRMPKEAQLRIDALRQQALGEKGVGMIEERMQTT